MPKEKQQESKGGRPGKNSSRPTNKRYSAGKKWIVNSAKRVFKHLKVHGPLNHRREDFAKPTVDDVELLVMGVSKLNDDGTRTWENGKMSLPDDTWKLVKRMVARWISEAA